MTDTKKEKNIVEPNFINNWYTDSYEVVERQVLKEVDDKSFWIQFKSVSGGLILTKQKVVDLEKVRIDLENLLYLRPNEILDFDWISSTHKDDLIQNSLQLTKDYGFLKIGKKFGVPNNMKTIVELQKLLSSYYSELGHSNKSAGIASLLTPEFFREKNIEELQTYTEMADEWLELMRTMFYLKFFSGKEYPEIDENLEERLPKFESVFLSQLDDSLSDIYPMIDWKDSLFSLTSKSLKGAFLLYYIDAFHIPLKRCLTCRKHFLPERKSRKFCKTGGKSCSKIYQAAKKNNSLGEDGFVRISGDEYITTH